MTIRWKPHILDLNPFCLIELFEYFGIDDLCRLAKTCAKFKEIAETIFILKYANEVKLKIDSHDDTHLTYEPSFHNHIQASGMLKNFRHLIKSIIIEHEVEYRMYPVAMRHITELIRDKFNDFSDLFFHRQSPSLRVESSLKECIFAKSGRSHAAINRFGRTGLLPGDFTEKQTQVHFFNLTEGTFIRRLKSSRDMNAISICVEDSLPSECISQLCQYAPKIEFLALYQMGETNFDIKALKGLKHLKVLNLSLCNVTSESLKSLHDLNVTIESLLIRGAILDEAFMSYITKFKQLKALVLTDDNFFDESRLAQIVSALPKLVTLVIDKKISIDGLKRVVKECPSLLAFEVDNFQSPIKYGKVKKYFYTLKRLYLASATAQENVNGQSQGHIYLAQSIPVFSYMFENMIK